jgi:hypothetical protein
MTDNDHIYYDLQFNNYQSITEEPSQLTFRETRNSPIINDPSKYNMSIVRFDLDTISLPSYVAAIQPNQSNPNLMIYAINLSYWDGTTEITIPPTYLIWTPSHKEASVPLPPSANSNGFQTDSIYYYGYCFQHICEILNTAFATAMTNLKAAVSLTGNNINTVLYPFVYFDNSDNKFHIVADNDHFNYLSLNNHIRIYFNKALYGLLSSFPALRNDKSNVNQNIYQIRITGSKNKFLTKNIYWDNSNSIVFIDFPQEYSTLSNFNPIASIIFTTSQIPVVPNQISAPLVFNNNQLVSDYNQNNLTSQIITDMVNNDDFSYKPNLLYNPSAEFRRISLTSNRPLNNIDIMVYWKNKRGELKPFYVWSGGSASIKILFEKKKLLS